MSIVFCAVDVDAVAESGTGAILTLIFTGLVAVVMMLAADIKYYIFLRRMSKTL